ncbi:hypothetical protein HHI36_015981 [Cryptolaemus montrouzieri]|uniref:Uncharacterized protein n=1 Tax=Cryptolaemus montrouzieri TaxID=559131 RepID=A0ABD2N7E0_9CUCU
MNALVQAFIHIVTTAKTLGYDKPEQNLHFFGVDDNCLNILRRSNLIVTPKEDPVEDKVKLDALKKKIEYMKIKLEDSRNRMETLRNQTEYSKREETDADAHIEKKIESLKKEELFFKNIINLLSKKVEKYADEDLDIQKVLLDSLLAWNNEDICVEIARHLFDCRKFERNVDVDVRAIMASDRSKFGSEGVTEESCKRFLACCASNEVSSAFEILVNHRINPDVSDCLGNSGLHFAAYFDNVDVIQMLANNGANMSIVNDEGLTALSLCLLRYLEVVHKISNWEQAFLPIQELNMKNELETQWTPTEPFFDLKGKSMVYSNISIRSKRMKLHKSSNSLKRISKSSSRFKVSKENISVSSFVSRDRFVFSLEYVHVPDRFTNIDKTDVSTRISEHNIANVEDSMEDNGVKLLKISRTVETLLHYGADLNGAGVPFPSFFMALFTESPEIVECFLKHKANPNENFQGMTALHIVSCLKPSKKICDIMKILIRYSANPNILSDPSVWEEWDEFLLGEYDNVRSNPRGKNALHLICLREDINESNVEYLCKMAMILVRAQVRTNSLYLGHSHLSMAVLKELGMSPFEELYNHANVIEFLDFDLKPLYGNKTEDWRKFAERMKHIRKSILQNKDKFDNVTIKAYICEKSRQILDKINKFKAVFYLYCFFREEFLNESTSNLAKFIQNSREALLYLQLIFKYGAMPWSYFSMDKITNLLKYVDHINKMKQVKFELDIRFSSGRIRCDSPSSKKIELKDYCYPIKEADFMECSNVGDENIRLVSDPNLSAYNVCYYCMHETNKILLRCPSCGIVKFCSLRCNYISRQLKDSHPCPNLFYENIFEENRKSIESGIPLPLYGIDQLFEDVRNRRCETICNKIRTNRTSSKERNDGCKCSGIRMRGGTVGMGWNSDIADEACDSTGNPFGYEGSMRSSDYFDEKNDVIHNKSPSKKSNNKEKKNTCPPLEKKIHNVVCNSTERQKILQIKEELEYFSKKERIEEIDSESSCDSTLHTLNNFYGDYFVEDKLNFSNISRRSRSYICLKKLMGISSDHYELTKKFNEDLHPFTERQETKGRM